MSSDIFAAEAEGKLQLSTFHGSGSFSLPSSVTEAENLIFILHKWKETQFILKLTVCVTKV